MEPLSNYCALTPTPSNFSHESPLLESRLDIVACALGVCFVSSKGQKFRQYFAAFFDKKRQIFNCILQAINENTAKKIFFFFF